MGRIFLSHIGGTRLFSCASCDTILTNRSELISTRFTGATGRAFLFNKAINLIYSDVQDRVMLTGRHIVRDVTCKNCDAKVGWMYEFATEENQRYKEGRVILERALITESEGFEEVPAPGTTNRRTSTPSVPASSSTNPRPTVITSAPAPSTAAIFSSFLGTGAGSIGSGAAAGMLIPREIFNFYGISPYALEAVAAGAVVAAASAAADTPAPQHPPPLHHHPQVPRRNNFVTVPRSSYLSPRSVLDGHGEGSNNPRPIFRSGRVARTQQPTVALGEGGNTNIDNAPPRLHRISPWPSSTTGSGNNNVLATTTTDNSQLATPQHDTTNSSTLSAASSSLLPTTRDIDNEVHTPNHHHQSTSRRQRASSARSSHHHHHYSHHHHAPHPHVHDPPHSPHHYHRHHPLVYHTHEVPQTQVANDESREDGQEIREAQRSAVDFINSCDEILPASALSSSSPLTSPVSSDFPPDTLIRTTFHHYFDDRNDVPNELAAEVIERAQEAMVVEETQHQELDDNSFNTQ